LAVIIELSIAASPGARLSMDNREEVQEPEQVGLRIDVEESGALVRYFDCTTAQTAADADGYAPNASIDIGGDGQIKIVAIARAKDRNTLPLTVIVSGAFRSRLINAKASGLYFAPYASGGISVPRAPLPMSAVWVAAAWPAARRSF